MSYEELMNRLRDWIAKVWNEREENKIKQIILQPNSLNKNHYSLTPIANQEYLLLFFIAGEKYPHYVWDIDLDRCARFFGLENFQDFFEEVRRELRWSGLDFIFTYPEKPTVAKLRLSE